MTRRLLFVNSGLLGHRSAATLLADAVRAAAAGTIELRHVDAGTPRHLLDRVLRRIACASIAPAEGRLANVDLARWRREWHTGFAARRRIRQALRGWPPHALHFHTQAAAYGSLPLMRRVPSIVSIDCTQTLAREEVGGTLARATYEPNIRRDRAVFGAARAIVATSQWAATDLQRTIPSIARRVRVVPYPVRLPPGGERWIEERYRSAPSRPCRFLFMGGDFRRKGGFDLLEVWRDERLHRGAELHIVTDWALDPRRLPPGVILHCAVRAYTPAWDRCWREADVFVMPTRAEAFGMVFQEAAAAGVPAIGTGINAIPEIVEDGRTGLLVPPADAGALAGAIRRLAADPAARREMGERARRRASERWSLSSYGSALLDMVDRCIREEAPAG